MQYIKASETLNIMGINLIMVVSFIVFSTTPLILYGINLLHPPISEKKKK